MEIRGQQRLLPLGQDLADLPDRRHDRRDLQEQLDRRLGGQAVEYRIGCPGNIRSSAAHRIMPLVAA